MINDRQFDMVGIRAWASGAQINDEITHDFEREINSLCDEVQRQEGTIDALAELLAIAWGGRAAEKMPTKFGAPKEKS